MQIGAERREVQRLKALHRYSILDTPAEDFFDDIVLVAALVCQAPIALISLVDDKRQWFKAKIGIDVLETARELSVCQYALATPDALLVIPDVTRDERFLNNPLVHGSPYMRFYAGAPLVTVDREVLGTLCVIDTCSRTLGTMGQDVLRVLARRVVAALDTRSEVASLQILSMTDSLTGLQNRRAFNALFNQEFVQAQRRAKPMSLILCDIDHFKRFNDTLGHSAGDRLLQAVAAALQRGARSTDHLARFGGDEFAIILPSTTCEVATRLAERIRLSVQAQFDSDPVITLSIGVAAIDATMEQCDALFSLADRALYAAKAQGRDQVAAPCRAPEC